MSSSHEMIDWKLAARVGSVVAGKGPETIPALRAAVWRDFQEFTKLSDELVRGFTGLEPSEPAPDPLVLDRAAWIRANLDGFDALIRPLTEKLAGTVSSSGFTRRLAAGAMGVQIGLLLGYLSQKVLGQYDLLLASESAGRVYFVGPNVVQSERRWGVPPRDFRLWITLHEITHRTQFTGVPWLRERVRALIARAIGAMELDPARVRVLLERGRELLAKGPKAWRSADVTTLLLSDEQRVVVGEVQALMCVVEGHGTFVMNRLGEEHIPGFAELKRRFDARRAHARGAERVLQRVIGMEMKYEQYAMGEAFMVAVDRRGGRDAVNKVWEREENLPSLDDLRDPDRWLERVHA